MKKHLFILTAICAMAFNAVAQNNTTHQEIVNLSAQRFKIITENDKNGVILDLRTTDEMSKGYIKGATQLDFLAKDAEKQIDNLDKNKTYYIYCASGNRSGQAAEYMKEHGFKRVYNLEKGLKEWELKGYPVEKK
ncbi:MAG: rhodanese-like domain-containing protein [Bacteroidia bacterium]|jgi:rhodanese-related sulfurtransferase